MDQYPYGLILTLITDFNGTSVSTDTINSSNPDSHITYANLSALPCPGEQSQ